jgi:uncharacterized DUF497 family protein
MVRSWDAAGWRDKHYLAARWPVQKRLIGDKDHNWFLWLSDYYYILKSKKCPALKEGIRGCPDFKSKSVYNISTIINQVIPQMALKFTWDEEKRKANLRKHALDFADVWAVFAGVTFTVLDERFDYGEERLITLGILRGVVVAIAHIEQEETVRVISMRKATNYEQKLYFEGFADELGSY